MDCTTGYLTGLINEALPKIRPLLRNRIGEIRYIDLSDHTEDSGNTCLGMAFIPVNCWQFNVDTDEIPTDEDDEEFLEFDQDFMSYVSSELEKEITNDPRWDTGDGTEELVFISQNNEVIMIYNSFK